MSYVSREIHTRHVVAQSVLLYCHTVYIRRHYVEIGRALLN